MYEYKTLENINLETLFEVFVKAFSDYQVKMDMPFWKFQQMLQRRGYVPGISIGAFKNDVLVGFVINGFRIWDDYQTVYDTGTGVIPECRKQGITTSMLKSINKLLKEKQVKQYLLEVIQDNITAYELYKKQGFEVTRLFTGFQLEKVKYNYKPLEVIKVDRIDVITSDIWKILKTFWEVNPSWQNSIDSINALSDAFTYSVAYIGSEIVAYGIIDRKTGDIPQIGVNKNYRRHGIGSSIVADLVNSTESERIAIINVDCHSKTLKEFCLRLGFQHYVDQYEMLLKL